MASRARTRTFASSKGSLSGFDGSGLELLEEARLIKTGSESHRRTNSVKKGISAEPPTQRHAHQLSNIPEQSGTSFQSWKFPTSASGSSVATLSDNDDISSPTSSPYSSPDSSLEYASLGASSSLPYGDMVSAKMVTVPDVNAQFEHRTRLSLAHQPPVSYNNTRQGHRTSPSLPYPPMMSTSYTSFHPAQVQTQRPFIRPQSTLTSLVRMVYHTFRRMPLGEFLFSMFFLACVVTFLAALAGVGYSPEVVPAKHSMPFPPSSLTAQRLNQVQPEAVVLPDAAFAAPVPIVEPPKHVQLNNNPSRKVVRPLRQAGRADSAPLNFAEGEDRIDDQNPPVWTRQKPAPRIDVDQAQRIQQAQKQVIQELADAELVQAAVAEESDVVSDEDLESIENAGLDGPEVDEATLDSNTDIDAEEGDAIDTLADNEDADTSNYGKGHPDDPAWDDAHAGHYHHSPENNIFDKAAQNPHDHASHASTDDADTQSQDVDLADFDDETIDDAEMAEIEQAGLQANEDSGETEKDSEYFDPYDYQLQDDGLDAQEADEDVHRMIRVRR